MDDPDRQAVPPAGPVAPGGPGPQPGPGFPPPGYPLSPAAPPPPPARPFAPPPVSAPRPVAVTVVGLLIAVIGMATALMVLPTWTGVSGQITGTMFGATVVVEDFQATVSGTGAVDIVGRDQLLPREAPTRSLLLDLVDRDVDTRGWAAVGAGIVAMITAAAYGSARLRWFGIAGTAAAALTGITGAAIALAGSGEQIGARSFSGVTHPGAGALATLGLSIVLAALAVIAAILQTRTAPGHRSMPVAPPVAGPQWPQPGPGAPQPYPRSRPRPAGGWTHPPTGHWTAPQ